MTPETEPEEDMPKEKNESRCAALHIAYENALLELESRQEKLETAAEAYSVAVEKFERVEKEARENLGSGIQDMLPTPGIKSGIGTALGVGAGVYKIKGASKEYIDAWDELQEALAIQEDAENAVMEAERKVTSIRDELSQSGCS